MLGQVALNESNGSFSCKRVVGVGVTHADTTLDQQKRSASVVGRQVVKRCDDPVGDRRVLKLCEEVQDCKSGFCEALLGLVQARD
jgi:hypothetical protein